MQPEPWVPGWLETHGLDDSPEHSTTKNLVRGFPVMPMASRSDQFRTELLRGLATLVCRFSADLLAHPPRGVLGFLNVRETVRPNHEVGESGLRR